MAYQPVLSSGAQTEYPIRSDCSLQGQDQPSPELLQAKPNPYSLPSHLADGNRQLMAGTVFSAKAIHNMSALGIMSPQSMEPKPLYAHPSITVGSEQNHIVAVPDAPSHTSGESSIGHGMQMSSHVSAPIAVIGSALAAGAGVASVMNAYQLGRNWEQQSHVDRAGEAMKLSGTVALAGVGGLVLGGIAKGSAMAVMPAVAIAAPVGLGAIAAGNIAIGAWNVGKIAHAGVKRHRINRFEKRIDQHHPMTDVGRKLLNRAKSKLSQDMKNRMIKVGILALTTIGLGIGAAVIAGALTTPFGWVAAGIVLAAFGLMAGIALSRYVYKKVHGQKVEHRERENFMRQVSRLSISSDKLDELKIIQQEIDDFMVSYKAKSYARHFVEMIGLKRDEQRNKIKLQLESRRQWFVTNLPLFEDNGTSYSLSAQDVSFARDRAKIAAMLIKLNDDYLSLATSVLIKD